jgi:hypothetical protein
MGRRLGMNLAMCAIVATVAAIAIVRKLAEVTETAAFVGTGRYSPGRQPRIQGSPFSAQSKTRYVSGATEQWLSRTRQWSSGIEEQEQVSRDEEIARLEAQLRQLRDSENAAESSNELDDALPTATVEPPVKEQKTAVSKPLVSDPILDNVPGKKFILSEVEIVEQDSVSSTAGMLPSLAGAVLAVAFLAFFSQIPIGQDNLNRYSATGSAATAMKRIDLGDLNTDQK